MYTSGELVPRRKDKVTIYESVRDLPVTSWSPASYLLNIKPLYKWNFISIGRYIIGDKSPAPFQFYNNYFWRNVCKYNVLPVGFVKDFFKYRANTPVNELFCKLRVFIIIKNNVKDLEPHLFPDNEIGKLL